jgi:serine/threonine protein kinase/tetratricopeptide (TPR) repeat protein
MPVASRTLDDYVEAFESAYHEQGGADLRSFLPPPEDPLHRSVLCELIRIDLEYGWESNRPRSLDDYRRDFPDVFDNPESVQEIAFEEYRLRRRAGQAPSPLEYAKRYGVNTDGWPAPTVEDAGEQLSVRLEEAARSFRAFRLASEQPAEYAADPWEAASVKLDSWQPPAGTDGALLGLFRELHLADDKLAGHVADGLGSFPQVGEDFLDFHLIAELGRGAFGRVFLARQAALAQRPVALKISPDVGTESQTLAQLQHTHIVPVYSVHRSGLFQAVCMPYSGTVTVADVVRDLQSRPDRPHSGLELFRMLPVKPRPAGVAAPAGPSEPVQDELGRLGYADAVLWLGARLASGLHHAHERGILHRDVKPANILITDEGLPMLLDFNVSEDLKQRGASAALVGGTLPYMAPEMLDVFKGDEHAKGGHGKDASLPPPGDGRCDVWSLGLVLFELMTGRFPFSPPRPPAGSTYQPGLGPILTHMLQERREGPPDPRRFAPSLSAATAAIIRHCLEPDPARRYPSARALQEDLERQLAHLPLRHAPEPSWRERGAKWFRRNPRLAVQIGAVFAALVMVLALTLAWRVRQSRLVVEAEKRTAAARRTHGEFLIPYRITGVLLANRPSSVNQLREGEERCGEALRFYGVLEDDEWQQRQVVTALPAAERKKLRDEVFELLFRLARVAAERPGGDPTERAREALALNRQAESCFEPGEEPRALWLQRADFHDLLNEPAAAASAREKARNLKADSVHDQIIEARDLASKGQFREALKLLEPAVLKEPNHYWALFFKGRCHFDLEEYDRAESYFTACIALDPAFYGPYVNRGLAYRHLRRWKEARADFDHILDHDPNRADTFFDRAVVREELGDLKGAESDITAALDCGTAFTRAYFLRARIRRKLKDTIGGDLDFKEGLRREPKNEVDWNARGFERMASQPDAAFADFDQALKLNPTYFKALINKVYILSEVKGKQTEARKILERILKLYPDNAPAQAGLAVVLARLGERNEAHKRIDAALDRDRSGERYFQAASVFAQTARSVPADADKAIFYLRKALDVQFGAEFIEGDRDLVPLRNNRQFKELLKQAAVLRKLRADSNATRGR